MGSLVADLAVGILVVAAIYVLVRPNSRGADLVTAVGSALTGIVQAASDLGSQQST